MFKITETKRNLKDTQEIILHAKNATSEKNPTPSVLIAIDSLKQREKVLERRLKFEQESSEAKQGIKITFLIFIIAASESILSFAIERELHIFNILSGVLSIILSGYLGYYFGHKRKDESITSASK